MEAIFLLAQAGLLVVSVVVYRLARRDLRNIIEKQQTPTLDRLEEVRSAVDLLLDELDRKIELVDDRIGAATAVVSEAAPKAAGRKTARKSEEKVDTSALAPQTGNGSALESTKSGSKYDEVYSLADSGVTAEEIARRTGLGSAEVEMVISLRPTVSD
jgi:hypothetical protein